MQPLNPWHHFLLSVCGGVDGSGQSQVEEAGGRGIRCQALHLLQAWSTFLSLLKQGATPTNKQKKRCNLLQRICIQDNIWPHIEVHAAKVENLLKVRQSPVTGETAADAVWCRLPCTRTLHTSLKALPSQSRASLVLRVSLEKHVTWVRPNSLTAVSLGLQLWALTTGELVQKCSLRPQAELLS